MVFGLSCNIILTFLCFGILICENLLTIAKHILSFSVLFDKTMFFDQEN